MTTFRIFYLVSLFPHLSIEIQIQHYNFDPTSTRSSNYFFVSTRFANENDIGIKTQQYIKFDNHVS